MNRKVLTEQFKEKCNEIIKKTKENHELIQKILPKMSVRDLKEHIKDLDLELYWIEEDKKSTLEYIGDKNG